MVGMWVAARVFVRMFLAMFALVPSHALAAEPYPSKPVRILVPFAPGGPIDVIARLVQPGLRDQLGQPVVIENRVGAGGNIGTVAAARSPADGYTLLANSTAIAINPALSANAGYDPERDFSPIANIATQPVLVVITARHPARDLASFLAEARRSPLTYAAPGTGTVPHVLGEYLLKVVAKADATAVQFGSANAAAAAVINGEPIVGTLAVTAALPQIRAGKLRALAITSATRSAKLPDVPTFVESGYPAIQDLTWVGLFAPAGTPPEIVRRLNAAVNAALESPEVRERLDGLMFDPVGGTSESFGAYVKAELARWARVLKETGIRGE